MAPFTRSLLVALFCLWMMLDDVTTDKTECKNGGTFEDNSCVCGPDYTGEDCGVEIEDDTEKEKVKKNLTECLATNNSVLSETEASSGSGSGIEPDSDSPSTLKQCENVEKKPVDGRCEFTNNFEGKIALNENVLFGQNFTTKNNSSQVKDELNKKSDCLLWKVYGGLRGVLDIVIVLIQRGDDDLVLVDYTVVTSQKVTQDSLRKAESLTAAEASDFMQIVAQISDQDECGRGLHLCDPNSFCLNSPASYSCDCFSNYTSVAEKGERHGSKCQYLCHDVNGDDYCMNDGVCFITTDQRGVCKCPANYAGKRCEREWHIFLNATLGLTGALGVVLIIFLIVVLLLCANNRSKKNRLKSQCVEVESNSPNGEYAVVSEEEEKGVSNPCATSDEELSGATKVEEEPSSSAVEEEEERL